jgi:hypothetical protein
VKIPFVKREIPKRPAAIALVLIAIAGVVAGREKPAIEVVESKPARIQAADAAPDIDLAKLTRSQANAPQNDPFAPRSFEPAVQHAVRHAVEGAPAAPSAPDLPFTYFGKLIENGKTEVFVMRGDELISIAVGQKIDGEYRVDAITESSIVFTYLPLKAKLSIELAEATG